MKFYNESEPIDSIVSSPDGKFLVVSSSKSNKVWFMSQQASRGFEIYGYAIANGHVLSCALTKYEGQIFALCVLNNGIA